MKTQGDLREILKKGALTSELDLERALVLDRQLRLLVKEHPELAKERKQLRTIIMSYEDKQWKNTSLISDKQIKESDEAELIAEQERRFRENRKELIKKELAKYDLTQQDLGVILGHGKSYMSELINGITPFSSKDLIIIHRLFHVKLEHLMPTILPQKDILRVKASLSKLNKPKKEDLVFA